MTRARRGLLSLLLLGACAEPAAEADSVSTVPDSLMRRPFVLWPTGRPLPTQGYDSDPRLPVDSADLVIQPAEMRPFYGPPGEFGYYIDGAQYGFRSLSFILTETHPNGGPDLHSHDTEEAHVVYDGTVLYLVGERRFTVRGPYITRVPAGVPHTFMNVGSRPLHLTGVFPDGKPVYRHIGPNPLLADSNSVGARKRPGSGASAP